MTSPLCEIAPNSGKWFRNVPEFSCVTRRNNFAGALNRGHSTCLKNFLQAFWLLLSFLLLAQMKNQPWKNLWRKPWNQSWKKKKCLSFKSDVTYRAALFEKGRCKALWARGVIRA